MCPGDGNGRKLTGHHIPYMHDDCCITWQMFPLSPGRQAGRQSPERAIYRAARKPCWPPSFSSLGLLPSSPPLDKLVFWNDRRLFWAWQTMRKEGDAAAVAVALLTRGYICTLPSQYVSPSKSGILSGSTERISAARRRVAARNERQDDRSGGRAAEECFFN